MCQLGYPLYEPAAYCTSISDGDVVKFVRMIWCSETTVQHEGDEVARTTALRKERSALLKVYGSSLTYGHSTRMLKFVGLFCLCGFGTDDCVCPFPQVLRGVCMVAQPFKSQQKETASFVAAATVPFFRIVL